ALAHSGEPIAVQVDAEVIAARVELNVPMIRIPCMGSVLDPDSPLYVHVASLPLLGPVFHFRLLDDLIPSPVRHHPRDKRHLTACRQAGLCHLILYLLGQTRGQGHPARWKMRSSTAALASPLGAWVRGNQIVHLTILPVARPS